MAAKVRLIVILFLFCILVSVRLSLFYPNEFAMKHEEVKIPINFINIGEPYPHGFDKKVKNDSDFKQFYEQYRQKEIDLKVKILFSEVFKGNYTEEKNKNQIDVKIILENTEERSRNTSLNEDLLYMQFDSYLLKFNKSYSGPEYRKRFRHFKKSLRRISKLNIAGGAVYGLTKFSDMSEKEFNRKMLLSNPIDVSTLACQDKYMSCLPFVKELPIERHIKLPNSSIVDWRKEGVVGPIINQQMCGGCWAISIVGAIESRAARQGFRRPSLSIQEILDCVGYETHKCGGGDVASALEFMCKKKLTVVSEASYPTKFVNHSCQQHSNKGFRVKSFIRKCDIPETDLMATVATNGPVITLVNADPWNNYIGGVIHTNCDGSVLNHAVQIVGYDLTAPVPYYIVRNSWGEDFGENGYVYISTEHNTCGIASYVAYLEVEKHI